MIIRQGIGAENDGLSYSAIICSPLGIIVLLIFERPAIFRFDQLLWNASHPIGRRPRPVDYLSGASPYQWLCDDWDWMNSEMLWPIGSILSRAPPYRPISQEQATLDCALFILMTGMKSLRGPQRYNASAQTSALEVVAN